jgi:hypothetical protein
MIERLERLKNTVNKYVSDLRPYRLTTYQSERNLVLSLRSGVFLFFCGGLKCRISYNMSPSLQSMLFLFNFLLCVYRVSQEKCARLRVGVPYGKVYQYNPKHLCPKLNCYGDNGQRSLKL